MNLNELKILLEQKSTVAINQLLQFKFSNLLDVEEVKKRLVKEFCKNNGYQLCILKEDIIKAIMSRESNEITDYFADKGYIIIKENKLQIIIDDSQFEGKTDPTQYSKEDDIIYIKSTYDQKTDPEGWMVHEFKHADLKDTLDDGKQYPTNNTESEAYKAQFKFLAGRGKTLVDIQDQKQFPTLAIKFIKYAPILTKYWNEANGIMFESKVITEEMNPDYKSEMAKWDINDPRRRLGPALELELAKAATINHKTLDFEEPDSNKYPLFKKIPLDHYDLACPYCNAVMREKDYSFKYDGENKCWTHNCKSDARILMPPR
jgi:hypothetical protein